MRVAIIHDVFIEFGGAERVLLALLDVYPTADVYIPLLRKNHRLELRRHTKGRIISSWLNNIPLVHSASILLKPLLYLYWEQLNLNEYDLVISSSHSFSSKSVITSPHTLHVSYIHTPPRYLYTEFNETRILKRPFFRILLSPLLSWLRVRDFIGAQRPDILIANSKTVQARIKKYYRRDSVVIYPPVRIPNKLPKRNPQYFVCVSRLARQKGIDLAIKVCNQRKERLVIVGEGAQEVYLRSIAGPTIEFWGRVPDEKMSRVWAGAKALIYPSIEEDFGIVPVEAMAHGAPVIAHDSGALRESVIDGKTGVFFNTHTKESLVQAINILAKISLSASQISKHARLFSENTFTHSIKRLVQSRIDSL
jgi:glycosyltransferase involved in cell wall biosynthesis